MDYFQIENLKMLKSQVALLLINKRQYRLDELLEKLKHPVTEEEFLLSAVANDSACGDLWREIANIYLPVGMTVDRLDIPIDCYKLHVESREILSLYAFVGRPRDNEMIIGKPVLIHQGSKEVNKYELVRNFRLSDPEDLIYSSFQLYGLSPTTGTLGYSISYDFTEKNWRKSRIMLCSDYSQIAIVYDRVLSCLAEEVVKTCEAEFLRGLSQMKIFRTIFDQIPLLEEIKQILNSLLCSRINPCDFASDGDYYHQIKILRGTNPKTEVVYFCVHMTVVQLKF